MQNLQARVEGSAEQPAPALEGPAVAATAPVAATTPAAATAPVGTVAAPSNDPSSLRNVVVNGKRLDAQELAYVDMLDCGVPVPDGNYWLNSNTRTWGYAGRPEVHAFPQCNADPVVQQDVDQNSNGDDDGEGDSDSSADELARIRHSTEMSRYQTEIDRMENNGGMYVPSR
jgi:hypothetical protein